MVLVIKVVAIVAMAGADGSGDGHGGEDNGRDPLIQ